MIEYIHEQLLAADEYTVEQIYDFLQEVEYWKEVIQISNRIKGGVSVDQMRSRIVDALETLPKDIIELLYKIVFHAESGLE